MKKIYKIMILSYMLLFLIFEILPYNVILFNAVPIFDDSGVLQFVRQNPEYHSYFDIAVFGRGNIFAFPAGVFTALTFVFTLIYTLTDKYSTLKAAFAMNVTALAAELAQILTLGENFLSSCATITGGLLLMLVYLMIFLAQAADKTGENIAVKEGNTI